jgi:rod shape-determining protein MreD
MNWVHPVSLLLAAIFAVFLQASSGELRVWLGAQPDLLPALIVYTALSTNFTTTVATAVIGGLAFDALSAGPFGLAMIPLVLLGLLLHARRDVLLRDSLWAQALLGGGATLGVSALSVGLLFVFWPLISTGTQAVPYFPEQRTGTPALPRLGFGFIWQLTAMTVMGAMVTPIVFRLFRWVEATFNYRPAPQPVARTDREIQRGRF